MVKRGCIVMYGGYCHQELPMPLPEMVKWILDQAPPNTTLKGVYCKTSHYWNNKLEQGKESKEWIFKLRGPHFPEVLIGKNYPEVHVWCHENGTVDPIPFKHVISVPYEGMP